MPTITPLSAGPVTVRRYDCDGEPGQAPQAEAHAAWSVSYVRQGSFGCHCRGRRFDLVPGSLLLGRTGDEYTCTHDHHDGGDQCLAVFLAPDLVDELAVAAAAWTSGALPPLAELVTLGEQLHPPPLGATELSTGEVGLRLAARVTCVLGRQRVDRVRPTAADRRRAVESALWIAEHPGERHELASLAARSGQTPLHYLRLFAAVLGVTPHQYLLRQRLRAAAGLLAQGERRITDIALDCGFDDLSNFTRTFGRAAGLSPRAYRTEARARRAQSRIFQVGPPPAA